MKLPFKSLEFLRACLAEPGWNTGDSKDLKHQRFYLSSKLLVEGLPEVPETPLPKGDLRNDPVGQRAFAKETNEFYKQDSTDFTLSEKEFECCAACLHFFVNEDRMPKGAPGLALYDAFKLELK